MFAERSGNAAAGVNLHFQFFMQMYRHILCERNVSVLDRLTLFDQTMSPIAALQMGTYIDLMFMSANICRQIPGGTSVRVFALWARLNRPTWSGAAKK